MGTEKKTNVTKIYCDQCDSVFNSKEKFNEHLEKHSDVSCEFCPVDLVVNKIKDLIKRRK